MMKRKAPRKTNNRKKAIAVAKDVLKRLRYLSLVKGTYMAGTVPLDSKEAKRLIGPGAKKDLQEVVKDFEKNCQVCLLGACVLSKARLYDKVPLKDMTWGSFDGIDLGVHNVTVEDLLEDVFCLKQMKMMETAFEMTPHHARQAGCTWEAAYAALAFGIKTGRNWGKEGDRVRAVMLNVIANGGVFVPPPVDQEELYELANEYSRKEAEAYHNLRNE